MSRLLISSLLTLAALALPAHAQQATSTAPPDTSRPVVLVTKIQVGDREKSYEFYKQVVGLHEVGRSYPRYEIEQEEVSYRAGTTLEEARAGGGVTVNIANAKYEFNQFKQLRPRVPYRSNSEVPVLIMGVPDIDAVVRRAKEFGAPVLQEKEALPGGRGWVFEVFDPSNNVVEFVQLASRPPQPNTSKPGPLVIKIHVGDMERSHEFYKQVLGLTEVSRAKKPYNELEEWEVVFRPGKTVEEANTAPGIPIVLVNRALEVTPMGTLRPKLPHRANTHLPVLVLGVPDVAEVMKRAKAFGTPILRDYSTRGAGGGHVAYIHDPSYNVVELLDFKNPDPAAKP